jgi:AcrR family transcriptional regulator
MTEAVDLRAAQRAATRDRIVQAVSELVAEGHPAAISVPAVAKRSGVSLATIYRYFPTKEALLDAATTIGLARTMRTIAYDAEDASEYPAIVRRAFREFAQHVPLIRNQVATTIGRDLRQRRREDKRERALAIAAVYGVDPGGVAGEHCLTIIEAMLSSTMFLELHDQMGLDPDTGAEHLNWAIRALFEYTARAQQEKS